MDRDKERQKERMTERNQDSKKERLNEWMQEKSKKQMYSKFKPDFELWLDLEIWLRSMSQKRDEKNWKKYICQLN